MVDVERLRFSRSFNSLWVYIYCNFLYLPTLVCLDSTFKSAVSLNLQNYTVSLNSLVVSLFACSYACSFVCILFLDRSPGSQLSLVVRFMDKILHQLRLDQLRLINRTEISGSQLGVRRIFNQMPKEFRDCIIFSASRKTNAKDSCKITSSDEFR